MDGKVRYLVLLVAFAASALADCSYSVAATSATTVAAAGGVGTVSVTTQSGCAWTATVTSGSAWLIVSYGDANNKQSGSAGWAAAKSTTGSERTGTLLVAGTTIAITQKAQTCTFTVVGATPDTFSVSGGSDSIQFKTNCEWTASTSASWIAFTGTTSGTADATVYLTVAANPCADARVGTVTIGGQSYAINQLGSTANLTLAPASVSLTVSGGSGSFAVTTGTSCSWKASTTSTWLTLSGTTSQTGSGTVAYQVAANTGSSRTATVSVGTPATFKAIQDGVAVTVPMAISAIVNSASYAAAAVAPGEIVTIWGTQFGPATIATATLALDGASLTKILGSTRVLFDGTPAAMIFAISGQVSAVVPYGVAGQATTSVVVEYQGTSSPAYAATVRDASPGIFTITQTGTGAGAILNQDGTVNSTANAAERGSVIMIYCTGGGVTSPASADAELTSGLKYLVQPVTVTIGGVTAKVDFSGGTPSSIAGLTQINAEVPAASLTGDAVAVKVKIGDWESQDGVTVAVK